MNLWRLLLAMYVLVLSGLPCEALCQDEASPVTNQAYAPTAEHEHEESCSPFCLCATCTCPGFNLPHPPQLLSITVSGAIILVAQLPAYQASHTVELPGRIWQPPRFD